MKAKKKEKKFRKAVYIPAAAVIVLALVLIGIAGAKYLYKTDNRGSIRAKEFYFTSNLLDEQTHTLAPGSTQITFSLGNHQDALRYSETPIKYTVKVNGITPDGSGLEGELAEGSVQDASVTIKNLTPGQIYKVAAEGVGGYRKTLTATLVIPEAEKYLYKYLDTTNSEYVLLTVWAKGVSGNVSITPPDTVLPDNTDAVMANARTGAAFTDSDSFKTPGYSSHVYRFFGSGVTASDFAVICGDITAEEKAPN